MRAACLTVSSQHCFDNHVVLSFDAKEELVFHEVERRVVDHSFEYEASVLQENVCGGSREESHRWRGV